MTRRLRCSLPDRELAAYCVRQINAMFPDGDEVKIDDLMAVSQKVFEKLEYCFSMISSKYFFDGSKAVFSHLHGDQYAMWLYMISHELFLNEGSASICNKLFLLNKALHGCDIFYEVSLPDIFLLVHPLGTVLGRGEYGDYFVAYQRCGVGSNRDVYPSFGKHVTLRPGSSVLGDSRIGDYCQIAADSLVLDRSLPDHSLYIGNPKTATVKRQDAPYPLWRV